MGGKLGAADVIIDLSGPFVVSEFLFGFLRVEVSAIRFSKTYRCSTADAMR